MVYATQQRFLARRLSLEAHSVQKEGETDFAMEEWIFGRPN